MKKLFRFNLILSAVALIMIFSSFNYDDVYFMIHPYDHTMFLKTGSTDPMEATIALNLAYRILEGTSLADWPCQVGLFQCPWGLWFNQSMLCCDYPENCYYDDWNP